MPKKGTRTIEVDGVRYRYRGDAWRMEGDDCGEVLIELADRGREKVRATFTYTKLSAEYRRVGHALSHAADTMPPYVVRQTILHALSVGWDPHSGGGLRELGNLDEVLDFSGLDPASQDPGGRR